MKVSRIFLNNVFEINGKLVAQIDSGDEVSLFRIEGGVVVARCKGYEWYFYPSSIESLIFEDEE